jgi:hypothetical protein
MTPRFFYFLVLLSTQRAALTIFCEPFGDFAPFTGKDKKDSRHLDQEQHVSVERVDPAGGIGEGSSTERCLSCSGFCVAKYLFCYAITSPSFLSGFCSEVARNETEILRFAPLYQTQSSRQALLQQTRAQQHTRLLRQCMLLLHNLWWLPTLHKHRH